jgi:anti-sigma28 factor (negative regulator of flagellin synthesis)
LRQKAALDNNQKLNDLKNQIKTGQFKVDSNVIANKILADKNSLHSLLNQ